VGWRIFYVSLTVVLVLLLWAGVLAQEGDSFEPGKGHNLPWVKYDEAVSQAKTDSKAIMLYFYSARRSEICKQAETVSFTHSLVKSLAKKLPVVKISSEDDKELAKKYKVSAGSFAIVFVNFQLREIARVTTMEKLKKLHSVMKDARKTNDKLVKKHKELAKAFKKAMKYKRSRKTRKCILLLQGIVALEGKIDSAYIQQAEEELKAFKSEVEELLRRAEADIDKARGSLNEARQKGSSAFHYDYVASAQKILRAVEEKYPLSSVADRIKDDKGAIDDILAEYQKILERESERQKKK